MKTRIDKFSPMNGVRSFLQMMLLVMLTGSVASRIQAQEYPGHKPVENLPSFKKNFKESSASIQSVKSDFTQVKTLSALTEKITSYGKFWFKRNNKVRLDYTRPFTYRMIINGDKVLVKDDHQENHINVRSSKLFQQINNIMVQCIQGNIVESRDFATRVFESDSEYLLELTPASKNLRDFFHHIVLVVDKKDHSVKTLELNEPSGDKTLMTFSNKVLNEQLPDEVFAF